MAANVALTVISASWECSIAFKPTFVPSMIPRKTPESFEEEEKKGRMSRPNFLPSSNVTRVCVSVCPLVGLFTRKNPLISDRKQMYYFINPKF